jgi:tetratricopeptide (TPR) repeat protein
MLYLQPKLVNMQAYLFYIRYRLYIGLVFLALAIFTNYTSGFWPASLLYLIGIISVAGHFIIGPMRLIQGAMEAGDLEAAKKVLDSVWFPGLLLAPMRSVYYTVKGNLAMVNQDFATAEANLKKSNDLMSNSSLMQGMGAQMKQAEGANKLQLGMMALQKGDMKTGESYIRQAIRAGLPDNENNAAAYLQLCSIMMQKREFRAAKDYFKKAKAYKPKTPELVGQIAQIEKYIGRMPG